MGILKNLFGKKDSRNPYGMMRDAALTTTPTDLDLEPTPEFPNVFGMIMEEDIGGGGYTLIAFGEGSVSLYFSNGGGIIGAGQHETVSLAANKWFLTGQSSFDRADAAAKVLSPNGVLFTWKDFGGNRSELSTRQEIESPTHPLHHLYGAAQNVITQIREIEESRR